MRKEVRKGLYYAVCVGVVIAALIIGWNKIQEGKRIERENDLNTYKDCIQEQSDRRGWIIRSECSLNYEYYDSELGLEYEMHGKDLYLKK